MNRAEPMLEQRMSRLLLDNITARVAVVDREYRYVYVNRELLEFFGKRSEEVVGRPLQELIGEAASVDYIAHADRAFAGEAVFYEGWVHYPDKGARFLSETFLPYDRGHDDSVDTSGDSGQRHIDVIAVLVRDRTELKLRETELADRLGELNTSEALKSAIVDYALAALITTDDNGRIVEFNPAAETMFQRRLADVKGRAVSSLLIPERFRPMHEAGMQRMRDGQAPRLLGKRMALHAQRADGNEFPIEMVLWRTGEGPRAFYTASLVDMTHSHEAAREIERQREALRQSEKLTAMGSLLAGVAHELNNPLAIVMGRASLLQEKCEDLPDLQVDAMKIHDAAERCGRIVRTFLDMARRRPSHPGPVPLNDMVRAAVDMLRYGYRSHGITLELALADRLPPVNADGDQIGQIVMNLLVNAQQALASSDGERRVYIETGVEQRRPGREPRVWLRVADSGTGVSDALRARLFEPFFTTKPEGVGTGLGLAVSRSLARDHGGELALEAAPTNAGLRPRGASFRLSLPISGQADAKEPAVRAFVPASRPQTRVLVVDDEADLAGVMREMLESAGHEVATAESGMVALQILATRRFDAIVSDLRMPDMDGAALWREVSRRHGKLANGMLFVTGDTLSPAASEFLRSSGCASLDKPFSEADLLARVSALLG